MTSAALDTSYEWVRRTNGTLTEEQRTKMRAGIRSGYADIVTGLAGWPIRRSRASMTFPTAPDSRLAKLAEEAAHEQTPALRNHGYRTWLIGSALAEHDHESVDAELLYVAGLLHDAGMMTEVAGQDFTARSGDILVDVCGRADAADRGTEAADAAVAHATPGLPRDQSPVGYYVQAGAMADLAGLRMWHLPRGYLKRAFATYPSHGVHTEIPRLVRREAAAVPDGRFAMLKKAGMDRMVVASPTRLHARTRKENAS